METKENALLFNDFAIPIIQKENRIRDKKELFQLIVFAWNFSYWEENKREQYFNKLEEHYISINYSEIEIESKIKKIKDLIKQKEKFCPDVKNQILESKIHFLGNKVIINLDISEYDGKK